MNINDQAPEPLPDDAYSKVPSNSPQGYRALIRYAEQQRNLLARMQADRQTAAELCEDY